MNDPIVRSSGRELLKTLRAEMNIDRKDGIYERMQVDFSYFSNSMEGCRLTYEDVKEIYDTRTLSATRTKVIHIDDIAFTINHFSCVKYILEHANRRVSENMVKELHGILKSSTSDSMKSWFSVGDYKRLPNEVGGMETTAPEDVASEMIDLISSYESKKDKTLRDIISFHVAFERIHPFQDGNGRVGRLIMFKECLRHGIVPFIIDEETRNFYYRGLSEWGHVDEYLIDTCLYAEDKMKALLDYFRIDY